MINIIGNIKIDESKPERIQQFFATLLSYAFIPECFIGITLNSPSKDLILKTGKLLGENFSKQQHYALTIKDNHQNKRPNYITGLSPHFKSVDQHKKLKNKNYLNFEEDHFCVMDNAFVMEQIFEQCNEFGIDIVRASYFPIEVKSMEKIIIGNQTEYLNIFMMDEPNFKNFQFNFHRFFIGTNAIFNINFAKKFYNRPGSRPHDFEISQYDINYMHTCCIPKVEILRSIDNDHEAKDSSLLKQPTEKFTNCMKKAKKYL